MKPSKKRTTIFKLIVRGIELHAAFEERDNKQSKIEKEPMGIGGEKSSKDMASSRNQQNL